MKRLLFIATILITCLTIASNPAMAQPPTTQQIFSTKINEYEVGVKRNVSTVAQQSFSAAMVMINDEIASLTLQIQNTTNPTVLATLNAKKNAEQQIYTTLQGLQGNIVGNYAQIKVKLDDFLAMM